MLEDIIKKSQSSFPSMKGAEKVASRLREGGAIASAERLRRGVHQIVITGHEDVPEFIPLVFTTPAQVEKWLD